MDWNNWADLTSVGVVCVSGYLIIRILAMTGLKVVQMWTDAVKTRAEADKLMAENQKEVAKHLSSLTEKQETTESALDKMKEASEIQQGATMEVLGGIKESIDRLPEKVKTALHDDLKDIRDKASALTLNVSTLMTKIDFAVRSQSDGVSIGAAETKQDTTIPQAAEG